MERKRYAFLTGSIMNTWVEMEKRQPYIVKKKVEAMLKKVLFAMLKTDSRLAIEESEEEREQLKYMSFWEVEEIWDSLTKKGLYTEEMDELMKSVIYATRNIIGEG